MNNKSFHQLITGCTLTCAAIVGLSTTTHIFAADEVWFALRGTNVIGSGTLQDPYNGSGGYFHWWLAAWTWNQQAPDGTRQQRSNLTIHLLPSGTGDCYQTGGGNVCTPIPLASSIKGAGINNTIIRLSNINTSGDAPVLICGDAYSNYNNQYLHLSDVTLDCNWGGTSVTAAKTFGIMAFANNTTIERVKVVNFGVGQANYETFPIHWESSTNGGTCTIQDCIVEGPVKGSGYATCISAFGSATPTNGASTAKLYNNKVLNVTNGIAYALGQVNATMEGNVAIGCAIGFSMDSWINEDCIIRNNIFKDIGMGIHIGVNNRGSQTFNRYMIENNYIEVNNSYLNNATYKPTGLWFAGNTTNFIVRGNIIVPTKQYLGVVQTNWYGFYFTGGNHQGLGNGENIKYDIENNIIDVAFQNQIPSLFFPCLNTAGNYLFNNHDFRGRSLKGFPVDQARGDQMTSITLSGTTYTLSDDRGELEGFVSINSEGASVKTITLPEPAWHSGRKFRFGVWNHVSGGSAAQACPLTIATPTQTYAQVFDTASQAFGYTYTYQINSSGYIVLEICSNGSQWVIRK